MLAGMLAQLHVPRQQQLHQSNDLPVGHHLMLRHWHSLTMVHHMGCHAPEKFAMQRFRQ